MRRTTSMCLLLLTALSGCSTSGVGGRSGGGCPGHCGVSYARREIPGYQGPWGQPISALPPYNTPMNETEARAMMSQSLPLNMVAFAGAPAGAASGVMQAGFVAPAGLPPLPGLPGPAGIAQVGGCCKGGDCAVPPPVGPPGAVAAVGALSGCAPQRFPTKRTSVRFLSPAGMKISWYAPTCDGKTGFSSTQIEAPGRYNFLQAAIYRLKISDIANRPGLELYPTLEVVPSNSKTDPFLAHSSVPISFTDEDFDQVAAGNFVVKVIYLPDPQFQDLATTGPDEVVSSRLEPGVDPIAEAHRRGSILLIIRIGNIDLEAPNTPPMDAPSPYAPKPHMPPLAMGAQGMMPPNMMGQGNPMMMGNAALLGQGNPMMMGQGNPAMGRGNPMMMGQNGPMIMPPAGAMPGAVGTAPNGGVMMIGPNGPVMVGPRGPMALPAAAGNPATQPGAMLPPSMPSTPAVPMPTMKSMPQAPTTPTSTGSPSTRANSPVSELRQAKNQPRAGKHEAGSSPAMAVQQVSYQTTDALASQDRAPGAPAAKKADDKAKKSDKSGFWSMFTK